MSYRFVQASTQRIRRTTPTGIATASADWSLLFWFKPGTRDTVNGNGIIQIGPAGTGGTRGFMLRQNPTGTLKIASSLCNSSGATVLNNGTFYRVSMTHNSTNHQTFININGALDATCNPGAESTDINAGDVFDVSTTDSMSGASSLDGDVAWVAWVQGVNLTAAAADDYLNQTNSKTPCSLVTDYGVSGGITANALKLLWPLGNSNPFTDLSGVGNDGTQTNTPTNVAMPSGLPEACTVAAAYCPIDLAHQPAFQTIMAM